MLAIATVDNGNLGSGELALLARLGGPSALGQRARGTPPGEEHGHPPAADLLDAVVEHLPDLVLVKEARELRYVRVNRAAEDLLEVPRAALIGRNAFDLFAPAQALALTRDDREVLAGAHPREHEEGPVATPSHGTRWLHTVRIPITDAQGAPLFLLVVCRDVTARTARDREILALNAALERRAAELEAANRELEAFSSTVSHDLRAPLRQARGYLDLLDASAADRLDEKSRRYLRMVGDAAKRMDALIEALLRFCRTALAEPSHGPVDMERLVRETIAELAPAACGRRIEWQIGPVPTVEGDAALLRQVWANLVGNAVKYTGPRDPARIEVGAQRREHGPLVFYVRDNGVGFDMQYARRLFGVFQRLHAAGEFEGTGIGLATAQRIVARHGGRIWAQAAPGEGATFFFTLGAVA